MNNLEFINLEIAVTKTDYKNHINFGQTNFAIADEKRLKRLQQIKSKLEAWEVIKNHCDYQDGDRFNCIPEGFYSIEPIRGKDFLIVRKALEEKND